MYEAIKNFNKQFECEPKIENQERLKKREKFIVVGMGGSHLAADLLKIWNPYLEMIVHKNYGLPDIQGKYLKDTLVILSSYSGNTEETIDAFEKAREKNLSMAVMSIGGKLLELAKKHSIPYVQMPDIGIQPRSALGFSLMAILKIIGEDKDITEASKLAHLLKPVEYEKAGQLLAKKMKGFVPIIYSSDRNMAIAYNWKIKFNETGKIPAFYNVFPELNHNEMTGFDIKESTKNLSKNFYFIFLKDKNDHPLILKRMDVLKKIYNDKKMPVEIIELQNKNVFDKIFSNLILADWTAYHAAKQYGVEPEQVPMVEEFKKLI